MKQVEKSTGTKSKHVSVDDFMLNRKHPLGREVEELRKIIRGADPKISERIKWNAPSYFYKVDMAAFNLRQEKFVQLILIYPYGLPANEHGILQGNWKDRREARFENMADIKAKKKALQAIVKEWVEKVDRS